MNYPSYAIALAIRILLSHLIIAGLACAADIQRSDSAEQLSTDKPTQLEAFEVTGSRVKRLDYETPAPVIVFSLASIEDKGYSTLGDFVQSLSYNNSTSNSEVTTSSFVTGAATINPRGLGSNRVLTLVNGRRFVPYALTNSASGTPQTVFNFNSIPQSAIERIEYLKDGASAIYGSDAITGVFNIILKSSYSGVILDYNVSNTLKHDSLFQRGSIFAGISKGPWKISATVSAQQRHSNYLPDFGITTTDFRYMGERGQNFNSTIFNPSYLGLTSTQARSSGMGTSGGYYIIEGGQGKSNPMKADFVYVGTSTTAIPNSNRFDFANYTQVYPSSESYAGYATISRTLNPQVTAFGQVIFSRGDTHYALSPYGFTSTLIGYVVPANNPYNPTGLNLTNTASQTMWGLRTAVPKREVSTLTSSALAGLRGTIRGKWSWESAINYGENKTTRDTDQIRGSDLQAALSSTDRATAYNPFGPCDDPSLPAKLFTRSRGLDGKIDSTSWDLAVSGPLVTLPFRGAGELGLAAGFEYRHDNLRSNPEPENFLGFTATTPFEGGRNIKAAYVEISAPLQKWFEVQIAGRHERYSDFGNTTKPKFSGKIGIPHNRIVNVIFRGSYSQSFKAPDLGQLYQPQSNAVTTSSYLDPLRPQDAARQMRTIVGGNPNLKPEEGRVQYTGAVFEIPGIKGLSFSVDYFDVKIRNVINTLSASYLLSTEGRRQFPNAIVRDNSTQNPGPIQYIQGISNNLGLQLFRGIDYGLRYQLRNTRIGSITLNAEATQTIKRGTDSGQGAGFNDATGYYFAPRWRFNYSLGWRYKQYGATVTADVIGRYLNDSRTDPGWGENPYTIVSPSFSYRGFKYTTITIGSNNVFDKRPPDNGYVQLGFDDRAYNIGTLGRTLFLRIRREF